MFINAETLAGLNTAFKAEFQQGLAEAPTQWSVVATKVPSSTESNTYGWLNGWPRLREWIGDRQVKSLSASGYSITNREFESTVGVKRSKIKDDQVGIFSTMMRQMGQSAAEWPDELIFSLLAAGFETPCHDGQNYFDTEHPVGDGVASNTQGGAGEPWFLLDCSRPLKPLIYQEREAPEFKAMDAPENESVWRRAEFEYGVEMRGNAGFGFWQQAFASKATLDETNYALARAEMKSLKSDEGRPLAVRPTHLAVGPGNEAAAKALIEAQLISGGNSNPNYKDATILVVPWLAGA